MANRFDTAVSELLDAHKHPLRKEIDQLREIILAADRSIVEGVKWNTASFRTADWFATLNGPKHVKEPMVILHAGAKAKSIVVKDRIPDPAGMIKWLGNDRGQIVFKDGKDITARQQALQAIVSAWIQLV
ncbi:MAG: DUF1801 domain-containing protein [Flavobacteriales bacterium]|jgi:hypothetical protein|nr:DUF1801 domain-containing protein [Flavobacteriales bacterium]MBK6752437.1 DUF1801 domain-containing protein [Flavobacteriales bacterium]MBK7084783.1 DUF1801 domain-containing protein [Flavobacteriales bacterium]MBK7268798.1 DUF1801 domain-containing protein [Flavobacteriales bacterium]MBK7752115.1 DUF1801 domain-containing protein [Flavobacteriales bacterium]